MTSLLYRKASHLVRKYGEILKSAGIDNAFTEAEILVLEVINSNRNRLYRDNPCVTSVEEKRISELIDRRIEGEPLQYIAGYVDFLDLRLRVEQGVLIPRPETELLVLEAVRTIEKLLKLKHRKDKEVFSILDLCTGSGCIALSIAQRFPFINIIATDISVKALSLARENAALNSINNVFFICGGLFDPLKRKSEVEKGVEFDLIVSNPPYIKKDDIQTLQREIRQWEPVQALDGGHDGLLFYRKILTQAPNYLKKDGYIIVEIGFDQGDEVKEFARKCGFKDIKIKKDYAHFDRILSLCYK